MTPVEPDPVHTGVGSAMAVPLFVAAALAGRARQRRPDGPVASTPAVAGTR